MCQYNDRCPVHRHKVGTKCRYAQQPRTRSRAVRPTPVRRRTTTLPPISSSVRTPRSFQPIPPERKALPTPKAPPPKPRGVQREKNREKLIDGATDTTIEVGIAYLFEPDGPYEVLADRLLAKTKMRRRFGRRRDHWLCIMLNEAAQLCDTATYIDLVAQNVEKGLCTACGMPRVVAKIFIQCTAAGAKRLLAPTIFGRPTSQSSCGG